MSISRKEGMDVMLTARFNMYLWLFEFDLKVKPGA